MIIIIIIMIIMIIITIQQIITIKQILRLPSPSPPPRKTWATHVSVVVESRDGARYEDPDFGSQ